MKNFDEEYDKTARLAQGFILPLEGLIQVLLEGEGIRVHGVTSRIKSKTSVIRKLQRSSGERDIDSLTDMIGIRVVTYFPDEVDAVATVVEREFLVDSENSVDKRAALDPDRFGYLSLHYVLRLNRSRSALPEYSSYGNIRFELQIRSILQHAWAEIEHDLGYKSEFAVPRTVRRRFSRLAGLLEVADAEFLGLRAELARSSAPPRSFTEELDLEIERLLSRRGQFLLPAWQQGWTEADYNSYVSKSDPRFLLWDRSLISIPSNNGRFEPCDLLGPNDELIHVMRPRHSAQLGHLFNQAMVSTEILVTISDARKAFADVVMERGAGRVVSSDFRPRDVVLAFPSRAHPVVSMQQIPVISRMTLARVAQALESYGVTLHVIGIEEQLCVSGHDA